MLLSQIIVEHPVCEEMTSWRRLTILQLGFFSSFSPKSEKEEGLIVNGSLKELLRQAIQ